MKAERTRRPRPTVLTEAPRCPRCGSIRHFSDGGTHYKLDNYGERIERRVRCRVCTERFTIISD